MLIINQSIMKADTLHDARFDDQHSISREDSLIFIILRPSRYI